MSLKVLRAPSVPTEGLGPVFQVIGRTWTSGRSTMTGVELAKFGECFNFIPLCALKCVQFWFRESCQPHHK